MNKFFAKGIDQLVWSKPVIVVISIIISLLIWLFLVDPVKTITFSIPVRTLSLTPDNTIEKKNLIVLNQSVPESQEITITGRKSFIDSLDMEKFYALINFSKISAQGTYTLPVDGPFGGVMNGVKVIEKSPSEINLKVDKLNNTIVQVELRIIGTPKQEYRLITKSSTPGSIQLLGSASMLKKAAKAVVDVDVSGIDTGFEDTMYVKIVDENGLEIKGTAKQYKTVVKIEVAKEVPVIPVMLSQPGNGFSYTHGTASVDPKTVLLKGNTAQLDAISQIYTLPIDINGFTQDTVVDARLSVPNDVSVYGRNTSVKVTVPIQGMISRTLVVPTSLLQINNKNALYKYTIINTSLIFNIYGSSNLVNAVSELSLLPVIDVQTLQLGLQTVSFDVQLPASVTFDGKHEVQINVEKITN